MLLGLIRQKAFGRIVTQTTPDLALLDTALPDEDGFSLLTKLRRNHITKNLPVIMLSSKTNEFDRIKGLESGADDFILKPFSVLELSARINAVLRRTIMLKSDTSTFEVGNIILDLDRHSVLVDCRSVDLTYKGFMLLHLMMKESGKVFNREQIAKQVWKAELPQETRTVDMHIKTLRSKLGVGAETIKTVRNFGYKAEV